MTLTSAQPAYRLLKGVFAVYKPTSTPISALLNEISSRILVDLNGLKQHMQRQIIVFNQANQVMQNQRIDFDLSQSENVPVLMPDWFDHPLVQGKRFSKEDLDLHLGHVLDVHSCGVQVVGVGEIGKSQLRHLGKLLLPRRYRVKGQFGQASLSHSKFSKVVDRSTYDHITEGEINRLLTQIQGAHRNACISASELDLSSQRAYELASKGLLKPRTISDPIILELKLLSFNSPDFTIDATVINESCVYLRRMIHEIGYKLRSTALCSYIQRQADGPFLHSDSHTLLGHQVNVNNVINSLHHFQSLLKNGLIKRRHYQPFETDLRNLTLSVEPGSSVNDSIF